MNFLHTIMIKLLLLLPGQVERLYSVTPPYAEGGWPVELASSKTFLGI